MSAIAEWRLALVGIIVASVASACGEELGQCDRAAAEQLVYGRAGLVATKGQALVHDSCGNAAFCHSASADSTKRFGVPKGMDFDMLPAPTGWPMLADMRDEIWSQVEGGTMPPSGAGTSALGDGDWVFDAERREGARKLPALSSDEGKATLRNWLACGAPVVGETGVPLWAMPPDGDAGAAAADWDALHAEVIAPRCATAGCHNAAGARNAGMLDMSEACGARRALLASGPCGEPRVVAGDGDSLLLDKLESSEPRCLGPMPPTGMLPPSAIERVRAWVVAGARADACE